MNKGEKQIVGVFLAIVLIGGGGLICANGFGYTEILGKWRFPLQETGEPHPSPGDQTDREKLAAGIGTFQAQITGEDSADPNQARACASAFDLNIYTWSGLYDQYGKKKYSRELTALAAPTATQNLLQMRAEMGGYVYVAVKQKTGQAFYVDYAKILEDRYIEGYEFFDIDLDSADEFVFKYNMRNHYIPNSGFPVITFKTYLMTYDGSFPGITAFANVTSISTLRIDKIIKWYYTISATKLYIGIYSIEVTIGTTDLTKVSLKTMEIAGRGTLPATSFHKWQTASDIRYTITFSESSYDGALYQGLMVNGDNEFDLKATVTCVLVHPDDIPITVTVYYLTAPVMAGASDASTTYLQE
jgi:hypothetical protein